MVTRRGLTDPLDLVESPGLKTPQANDAGENEYRGLLYDAKIIAHGD